MGVFDFIKDAGASVFGDDDDVTAPTKPLGQHLRDHGISTEGLKFQYSNEAVTVSGKVSSQEAREKIVTIIGNVQGIGRVDDMIEVAVVAEAPRQAAAAEPTDGPIEQTQTTEWESRTYTVKSGDTLGKIARELYGNAAKYTDIFAANRPMLKDPNKIYPGQVLRIPKID